MVNIRSIGIVRYELEQLGIMYNLVEIGRVKTNDQISDDQFNKLRVALLRSALELLNSNKSNLVEKVKQVIIEAINDKPLKINFSNHLSAELKLDYTYLANTFSELEGKSTEQFSIAHKIQRAKELICYNKLNITQISSELDHSSVAQLSNQFKKVTGLTPSQ
jgi:AraC-like DNA-binding protein